MSTTNRQESITFLSRFMVRVGVLTVERKLQLGLSIVEECWGKNQEGAFDKDYERLRN